MHLAMEANKNKSPFKNIGIQRRNANGVHPTLPAGKMYIQHPENGRIGRIPAKIEAYNKSDSDNLPNWYRAIFKKRMDSRSEL